jgi:TolA-binding protein
MAAEVLIETASETDGDLTMPETHWTLDRRVPVAIIFAILLQSAGAIWWAASIQGRVANNEDNIARLTDNSEVMRAAIHEQAVQLGRIEEQINGLRGDIQRMLSALERAR